MTINVPTVSTDLRALFEAQMEKLVDNKIVESAEELEALFPLLRHIDTRKRSDGEIPFLIVPESELSLSARMSIIKVFDWATGTNHLKEDGLIDTHEQSGYHYLAVDVEDGRGVKGIHPNAALARFRHERRHGGSVKEALAMLTYFPGILFDHYLDLPGTVYRPLTSTPYITLVNSTPQLCGGWRDKKNFFSGSMSCARRLRI